MLAYFTAAIRVRAQSSILSTSGRDDVRGHPASRGAMMPPAKIISKETIQRNFFSIGSGATEPRGTRFSVATDVIAASVLSQQQTKIQGKPLGAQDDVRNV